MFRTDWPADTLQPSDAARTAPLRAAGAEVRRKRDVWVWASSLLVAALTVFVLLDTFAIGRVQQQAQAADFASAVAAQEAAESDSGELAVGSTATGQGTDQSDETGQASQSEEASDSSSNSSSKRSRGHGKASARGKGKASSDSGSGSSESATQPTSIVAGSASASLGTQVGSYSDENMQISVSQVRAYDTDIYVADIQVSSAEYLKTALAQGAFGRNLKDTTSNMAEDASAILAINGDYYGFRDYGYVVRNGVLYRDEAADGTDALVVYADGTMASVSQDEASAQSLVDSGAWQVLSFGPTLVNDGQLAVDADDEVDQSRNSNPRTAIGMVEPLHYVVVVSDGRTDQSEGLSLYQLAQVLRDNGATYAYNLDGGGSTTLYFKGEVLNNPTSGNSSGERKVSDIVYFG